MHRKNYHALIALLALSLLSSCAKEGPTGPTGPAGPNFTGTISGHVHLYDKYGSQVLTGLSFVRISLTGSAAVVGPSTIFANADGSYQFKNAVSTGNYTINAADTGAAYLFAATEINNIDFVAGTLNQDVRLSAIPDSFLAGFSTWVVTATPGDSLFISATPDARRRNCIIFVNSTPAAAGYLLHYIVPVPANSTAVNYLAPRQDLLNAGFASGAKVYYLAYSYVVNDASVYEDPGTGMNVYKAVNTNPIVDSTTVP